MQIPVDPSGVDLQGLCNGFVMKAAKSSVEQSLGSGNVLSNEICRVHSTCKSCQSPQGQRNCSHSHSVTGTSSN